VLPAIDHVWIFITGRCNVRCEHCFFAHKSERLRLSSRSQDALFRFLSAAGKKQFIISGGEPFMVWPATRALLLRIRQAYPQAYLSVQSNGLMMKPGHLVTLKSMRANLELGIDGDEAAVAASRRGLPRGGFQRLCASLSAARTAGVGLSTTMTVTPQNVANLSDNFMALLGLRARAIEIHPAFMAQWRRAESRLFLQGYRRALASELRMGERGLISREYSLPAKGVWDMVILPDGKVLANWTFLSFPEHVREQFVVMDLSKRDGEFLPAAKSYFSALRKFLGQGSAPVSYRRLSNFNASLAISAWGNPQSGRCFKEYVRLCDEIEQIDLATIRRRPA
jgi:hypothetical protein